MEDLVLWIGKDLRGLHMSRPRYEGRCHRLTVILYRGITINHTKIQMNNNNTKTRADELSITHTTIREMKTYYEQVDERHIIYMVEACKRHLEMEPTIERCDVWQKEMADLAEHLIENDVLLCDTHVHDLLKTNYCETRCTDAFRLGVRRTLLTIQKYCTPRSPYIEWSECEDCYVYKPSGSLKDAVKSIEGRLGD